MPGNTTRSGRRLRLGRTGAPCRDRSRWVSPARPPHPPCVSPRNGRSTCLARWSAARGWCRGPGGGYGAAAVAVAGHRDAGCAGEYDPVAGEPPSLVAETAAQFRHPDTVGSVLVLGAYPAHQPVPCVAVDVAEHGLGNPVPEVVRPPRQ